MAGYVEMEFSTQEEADKFCDQLDDLYLHCKQYKKALLANKTSKEYSKLFFTLKEIAIKRLAFEISGFDYQTIVELESD